jgi:hypothetical protein
MKYCILSLMLQSVSGVRAPKYKMVRFYCGSLLLVNSLTRMKGKNRIACVQAIIVVKEFQKHRSTIKKNIFKVGSLKILCIQRIL